MMGNSLKGCQVEVADGSDTPLPTLTLQKRHIEPDDGISNYVTGWKLTLKPDSYAFFLRKAQYLKQEKH